MSNKIYLRLSRLKFYKFPSMIKVTNIMAEVRNVDKIYFKSFTMFLYLAMTEKCKKINSGNLVWLLKGSVSLRLVKNNASVQDFSDCTFEINADFQMLVHTYQEKKHFSKQKTLIRFLLEKLRQEQIISPMALHNSGPYYSSTRLKLELIQPTQHFHKRLISHLVHVKNMQFCTKTFTIRVLINLRSVGSWGRKGLKALKRNREGCGRGTSRFSLP